jgi:ribonuclease J
MRMIPLGGCGVFGRNMTAYEGVPDAAGVRPLLIVDCGAQFPEAEAPGVELFLPDLEWLARNAARLRAYVITHAHEDHLRALPFALRRCPAPVYGRAFTIKMAVNLLREHGIKDPELRVLSPGQTVTLDGFTIDAIPVGHSIPDAVALAIRSGDRQVIHTGDLKLELDEEGRADLSRLQAMGDRGVDLLALDSTNSIRPGRARAEREVEASLKQTIAALDARVVVTLFASNVGRVAALCRVAEACGRQVCFVGRGLKETTEIGRAIGLLRAPGGVIVGEDAASWAPPNAIMLVVTGSQGEARAALGRLAFDDHPRLALDAGDAVVFSSRPVPGNELRVERIVDRLLERGIDVIDRPELHASGHAAADELTEIITALRPRALAPIHGRTRQLEALARLGERLGISVVRVRDGDVVEASGDGARKVDEVRSGRVSLEGEEARHALGDVGATVLRDRVRLARTGLVVAGWSESGWRLLAIGVCDDSALAPLIAEATLEANRVPVAGFADPTEPVRRAIARVFESARGVKPNVLVVPAA